MATSKKPTQASSINETENPVAIVCEGLAHVKEGIKELLSAPEYSVILLGIDADLTRMINRLHHITGAARPLVSSEEHPPITDFFGEAVETPKPLDISSLEPDEQQLEALRARVKTLYDQFDTIEPAGILNAHTTPEDQEVLRGVAKWAGLEDYADRDLDIEFIEDIQEAMKGKRAEDARQIQENERLAKEQDIVKLQERIEEVTRKRGALDNDLAEAEKALTENTDGRKAAKLQKEVVSIKEEIVAANELAADLKDQLEGLQS